MENIINEEKYLREKAEKELFKSKINPHFLFNSLNLIISLLNDEKKAEKAILSLSELLRYNLYAGNKEKIKISEEIDSIEKYLTIQKLRFGERLDYIIDCKIDENIPPMIIQPLIENCVKHNIDKTEKLIINIKIYKQSKLLIINIFDSNKTLNYNMIGKGIGLENTKKRVELSGGDFKIIDGGIIIKFKL
jgi:LytS/YehU family sensor histidine kinase